MKLLVFNFLNFKDLRENLRVKQKELRNIKALAQVMLD